MSLAIRNLNKSFGGIVASSDVSLDIGENETHAIVGPNGSGKTTLIAQLSGIIVPDSGSIHFNGVDITRVPPHRHAHIGLARSFQITSVIMPMTLVENVMMAVQSVSGHSFRFWRPVSLERDLRERAMQYLEDVGLKDVSGSEARAVSHGQRRQLEIAMALALNPRILLLDEPMAGMGKRESGRIIELLAGLKGKMTMLLVEHDMDAVFALADTASVLVDGSIIATGPAGEVRANPEVQRAYLGDLHA